MFSVKTQDSRGKSVQLYRFNSEMYYFILPKLDIFTPLPPSTQNILAITLVHWVIISRYFWSHDQQYHIIILFKLSLALIANTCISNWQNWYIRFRNKTLCVVMLMLIIPLEEAFSTATEHDVRSQDNAILPMCFTRYSTGLMHCYLTHNKWCRHIQCTCSSCRHFLFNVPYICTCTWMW